MAMKGAQFFSTHLPILLSYKAGIIDMNNNMEQIKYEDTDVLRIYKDILNNSYGIQKSLFEEWPRKHSYISKKLTLTMLCSIIIV